MEFIDVKPIDEKLDTLPKNFLKQAKKHGKNRIAMRKKRYGIWQEYSWEDSYNRVRNFTLGMMSLGFQRGEHMTIIGDNDPESFWGEISAHCLGMTTIGVFTDATPRELGYVINDSDSVIVIAHDQEQCDKMLELKETEQVPNVRYVVYWEDRGLWGYDFPWLLSFDEVCEKGAEYAKQHPNVFEEDIAQGEHEDIAILSYTSGTTGLPKGAMITHKNLLYGSKHVATIMPPGEYDDYVSFSPLAWITEQSLGLTLHLTYATILNFPEKPETVQNDIREIAPTSFLFPSRLWESLVSQVQARMADSHWSNRFLYDLFLPIGYKIADLADERKEPSLFWKLAYRVGDVALFAPLRDKMGLRRIQYAYTSGASLSPDVLRFFRAIDVELLQLYGSTECQCHTVHHLGDVRLGTVGSNPPGVQVKITDEGEIAIKSRAVFKGYYKKPEKTEEAKIDDWFHTGDAGYIDENGHLIYLDRMSDMIELASGEKFSPQYIEVRLAFSQYFHIPMAIGSSDMPYVSAIVTINFDNVARWAEKKGISFTTIADLSQKDEVYKLIAEDIDRVNQNLPAYSRVKRFTILHKAFDADESELTRTRKLRRKFMMGRYGEIINAIYRGNSEVRVTSEVVYQDGRKGVRRNDPQNL